MNDNDEIYFGPTSAESQKQAAIRDYYQRADTRDKQRLREVLTHVSTLLPDPADLDASVKGQLTLSPDVLVNVTVEIAEMPDGGTLSINPRILLEAIEAWDRGEDFVWEGWL